MADLGSAYINIVPKAPGIEKKIGNLLGDGGSGAEDAGESIGKKLLGGIAKLGIGAAVGKTLKDAFDAGGNLEQSFGGLDTIYEDASAAAKSYAMQAAQAGISANSYAEQAVSFGAALKKAFGGDTALAAEAANTAIMDMADNAAKMGTPLESIQTAYQGFARGQYQLLDNLKLGYGGTKTEMERLLADAQALTGVEYNIDNLGDVYAAIHVIQGELGLTGVAAEEANSTLTGSLNSVKASWENVIAAMTTGEGLDEAMSNFTASVGNFASNVLRMFGELAPQLPKLILGLADVVIQNAPEFLASGIELVVQLGVGLLQGLPDLIAKIPEIFARTREAFAGVDWMSIGLNIVNGIIDGLWGAASSLWNAIQDMAASAWQSAKQALGIASPSKVFADQVGQWIPAGMAEGIDDNLAPVNRSVNELTGAALTGIQPMQPMPVQQSGMTAGEMERLLEALQRLRFDFYLDGKQITDCVTIRQRNALRSGGVA